MSTNESVCVYEQYGPVKIDTEYQVIDNGFDFMTIRCHGKPICVPNLFLTRSSKQYKNDLPSYEDIISAEDI